MVWPTGPFFLLDESGKHFKEGKNQSKVSMESGVSVCVCRAGGETEEQRRGGLNCNQAKTREEGKMKAGLKKSLDGSTDEEADWGW